MIQHGTAILNTPKGSSLRNQAYQNMYNYMQQYVAKTKWQSNVGLLMGVWYANILSSYETHLRNLKYNATTVALSQSFLLAEKALLRKKPGEFIDMASDALKAFIVAFHEAKQILVNGQVSRFDKPGFRSEIESTKSKFLQLHKLPGRALRSADVLFTVPLYEMKQRELLNAMVRNEAKENGISITDAEVKQKVLEYLGKTPQRIATATQSAAADIEKVYGPNWKSDKKAVSNYHIRVAEIMEETRPQAVKEESIQWARRAVLTNEPRGIYKHISHALTGFGKVPGFKFYVPFVNVLLNATDRLIERTPISLVNAIRGKKDFGSLNPEGEELTNDERLELFIRVANYAVATTALFLAFGDSDDDDNVVITGKNTGVYMKDKTLQMGGKLDPFSVYVKGTKVMEYKDSPLSSAFYPVGAYRDFMKYGEKELSDGTFDAIAHATLSYLTFVTEFQAAKGLKDILSLFVTDEGHRTGPDPKKISQQLAGIAQNFYAPNILKATNNDVRGALGYNDYKAENWKQTMFKDIPFAEQLMNNEKYDHLGQPIKDQFKVPLVPFEKWQPVDKYYKFFTDHRFFPTYMSDKVVVVGNKFEDSDKWNEVELNPDQVRLMHQYRGNAVKEILNRKTGEDKTIMQSMETLPDDVFEKRMSDIMTRAGKIAKTRLFAGKETAKALPSKDDEVNKETAASINNAVSEYVSEINDTEL